MRCPYCAGENTQVKDSRPTEENTSIRLFLVSATKMDPFPEIALAWGLLSLPVSEPSAP